MSYRIVTDTCCDFPETMYEELQLGVVPLTLNFRGQEHDHFDEAFMKDMYAGMRNGESGSTAAVNPDGWASVIEPVLAAGEDVLVLAFSSGRSTTLHARPGAKPSGLATVTLLPAMDRVQVFPCAAVTTPSRKLTSPMKSATNSLLGW